MNTDKMIKSTLNHVGNMKDLEFQGYHKFRADDGSEYGSFEVFYESEPHIESDVVYKSGWYWWACFPGCMPDGEQNGPFPTAEGAYLDAVDENDGEFEQREAYLERLASDISPEEIEGDEPAGYSDYRES